MFYRNNAAVVALLFFTATNFHNLSHAQLNCVTDVSTVGLEGNCYQTTSDQVFFSVAKPMFFPTSTKTFTVRISEIYVGVTTELVLIAVNLAITPTFTTLNSIYLGDILLKSPIIANIRFRPPLSSVINNRVPTEQYCALNPNSEHLLS